MTTLLTVLLLETYDFVSPSCHIVHGGGIEYKMQEGSAVKKAAQALPPQHTRYSRGQPTSGDVSSVSPLTTELDVCADMVEVKHPSNYTHSALVRVAQNL